MTNAELASQVKVLTQTVQSVVNIINGESELVKKPNRTPVTNKSKKAKEYKAFGVRVIRTNVKGEEYGKTLISTRDSKLAKLVYDYTSKSKDYSKVELTALDGKKWVKVKGV